MDRDFHPRFSLKHHDGEKAVDVKITKITGEVYELEDEMALHVALRTEQLEQRGVSTAIAEAAARKLFGNQSRIAGASRDAWGSRALAR